MTAVKKLFERLAALVCAAVLLMSAAAFAAAPEASLTLECSVGGTAVPGAACRLYRVASLSGTSFTLAGAFGSAAVDLTSLSTADAWQTAADALPYGTYAIRETKSNDSYLLTDGEPKTFQIRESGAIAKASSGGGELEFFDQVVLRRIVELGLEAVLAQEACDRSLETLAFTGR